MDFSLNQVLGIIALASVVFNVFLYFRKPQEDLEKQQALSDKEIDTKATVLAQKEVENKSALLAQQLQWTKESYDNRFKEMDLALVASTTLAQNHIHTVDVKVDNLLVIVNAMKFEMSNKITELGTIISERIPKK